MSDEETLTHKQADYNSVSDIKKIRYDTENHQLKHCSNLLQYVIIKCTCKLWRLFNSQPMPVAYRPWQTISIDFITQL